MNDEIDTRLMATKVWAAVHQGIRDITTQDLLERLLYITTHPEAAQPTWNVNGDGFVAIDWGGSELILVSAKWLASPDLRVPPTVPLPEAPDDLRDLTG